MSKLIDLTGQRYGRLTVLEKVEGNYTNKSSKWKCLCDCGNIYIGISNHIRREPHISCGCWKKEITSQKLGKHFSSKSKLYEIWSSMKARCYRKNCKDYQNYGGRGIKIQESWKNDFNTFKEWSLSNGYKEGLTIERIDVNGNYEEKNCCWIKNEFQTLNRTNTIYVNYKGEKVSLAILCNKLNVPYKLVYNRIKFLKWNIEDAILVKPFKGRNGH